MRTNPASRDTLTSGRLTSGLTQTCLHEAAEVKAHEEEEANQVVKRFQVDRAAQAAGFAKFTKPAPPSHA